MRELTQEEIDLAPDWATHYAFDGGSIIYESKDFYKWSHDEIVHDQSEVQDYGEFEWFTGSKPIPRKPFDIYEHEFSDTDVEGVKACSKYVKITLNEGVRCVWMEEKDAIAIVKHFESVRAKNAET